MLRSSFVCFPGISEAAEQRLWRSGCLQWDHFAHIGKSLLSAKKSESTLEAISEAERALALGRADYFLNRLPPEHRGRVFGEFATHTAYLDIETTGLSESAKVTTAVLYKAGQLVFYVNDMNLFDIVQQIMDCRLLVTFNGTRFDVPLLKKALRMDLLVPHLDLLPVMRDLGFRGGLKQIERSLQIKRQKSDMDGKAAIQLWNRFKKNRDVNSLRSLLHYNAEDAIALEAILNHCYRSSLSGFPVKTQTPSSKPQPDVAAELDAFLCTMHFDK